MYAVVGKWHMSPSQREKQDRSLTEQVVPMVKQAPGFVSGQWARSIDGDDAVSYIVFKDQGSAEGFAALVRTNPENREEKGIESDWLDVVEILQTA